MDLENGKISRLLWTYSVPAVIGTVSNALYNIIDRIYIGQGVGSMAISGMALTLPLMALFGAFGMLVGAGAAARISISLGERNIARAENILGNALVIALIVSGTFYTFSYIFLHDILLLFGGTPQTIPYAEEFLRVIIPGQVFAMLTFSFNNMMRASGYPLKAMVTMLSGAVINTVIAPFFIFDQLHFVIWEIDVIIPCLNMGIRGSAMATVIAMILSCAWVMSHFFNSKSYVHFRRKNFRLSREIIFSILSIGLSPFLIQVAASTVNALMNHALKAQGGDLAIGAFGIINSLVILLVFTVIGLNQGMQPIIGYSYGARRYDRMFETLRLGIKAATVVSILGFAFGVLLPELPVSAFAKAEDVEIKAIAANGMRIAVAMFFLVGFQVVTTNFFQSIGNARISIFLSLTRQVIFLIPGIFIFPHFFGLNGVWMSLPVADFLAAGLSALALWWFVRRLRADYPVISNS